MSTQIAVLGDLIVNRPFRYVSNPDTVALFNVLRDMDASIGHLETTVLDLDEPNVYPSAEPGWNWMIASPRILDELRWLGIAMVSTASNHCMDYSYGGLEQTLVHLRQADVAAAGTGLNLGRASAPAFSTVGQTRLGLVSCTTSAPKWTRAGAAGSQIQGRPGVNLLRTRYLLPDADYRAALDLYQRMGWWITGVTSSRFTTHPPGTHHSTIEYELGDGIPGPRYSDADQARVLDAVSDTTQRADVVVLHIHAHDWNPSRGLSWPTEELRRLCKSAIDRGARIVVAQGSHAPYRGIEAYGDGLIFFDPGDVFLMDGIESYPAEFYTAFGEVMSERGWPELPGFGARAKRDKRYWEPKSPAGGYQSTGPKGAVIPLLTFDVDFRISGCSLVPITWHSSPQALKGVPRIAGAADGEAILGRIGELSAEYETAVEFDSWEHGHIGRVSLDGKAVTNV